MCNLISIKNFVLSVSKNFLQSAKIEVHQDRDFISKVIPDADTYSFINILFLTSISPCET